MGCQGFAVTALSEATTEQAALEILQDLGWAYRRGMEIAPDSARAERQAFSDVVLLGRLERAVAGLNPHLPEAAHVEAIRQVLSSETGLLVEENRRLHRLLLEGVPVEYRAANGRMMADRVWLVDLNTPAANDWLVVNQFTVVEAGHTRRADVVLFVNGLPMAVLELKSAAAEAATLSSAFNQLETYKAQIPSLFRTNAVLVISDGTQARLGSLTANQERFMPWRTVSGADVSPHGQFEMETLLRGVFEPGRFLALIRDFMVFGDTGSETVKIIAGYHQFHGARKALEQAVAASAEGGDRRIGVIWHTQGSGKSLLMAFLAGMLVKAPALANPTVVVLTDRNDLDDQLAKTFGLCRDLIRQNPEQADSRADLQRLLARTSGGVIFSTVQKFTPERGEENFPLLTDRRNVIVMADEAHRSQYGFESRLDVLTGRQRHGYAHYIRQALPNASFIGFTGTPIEAADISTPAIFGNYIDIYDISRAVEDGATVPIYYESRLARIDLDEDEKPRIDAEIEAMVEDETLSDAEQAMARWSRVEALVGAEKRLAQIAADMVAHLEARTEGTPYKGMAVCMSRRICVALYDQIIALRPHWHDDDDAAGVVKVVMTGTATDPLAWQPHIGTKQRRDGLAKRARDGNDPLRLVLVRDMWLTGFDAPCLNTMYVDKPMRGHGLMQAIARVNRVFRDKQGGLIVDYIGIAHNLKQALGDYTETDRRNTAIDDAQAVAALRECHEIIHGLFHGFDLSPGIHGTPTQRLACLAGAIDWVLKWAESEARRARSPEDSEKAHRRFPDLVLQLSKAFALASASDLARSIREEVGFFQAVRAAITKNNATGALSLADRTLVVQQLINRAIASAEIIDILKIAGIKSPNISILSDAFLLEIQGMEKKNLALEALRKLLVGAISSRMERNVVEGKAFSGRLEEAVKRYHAGALSAVELLNTLIGLSRDIKAAYTRGEEHGLSQEELAFYDALADNDSAVEAMGNEQLRVIACLLLKDLRANATIDWQHRESARALMRTRVKRILKKYGYPPDQSDNAVQTVLAQAEVLLRQVA